MHVVFAVPIESLAFSVDVQAYVQTSWGFSVATMALNGLFWILLLAVPLVVMTSQLCFAFRRFPKLKGFLQPTSEYRFPDAGCGKSRVRFLLDDPGTAVSGPLGGDAKAMPHE